MHFKQQKKFYKFNIINKSQEKQNSQKRLRLQ